MSKKIASLYIFIIFAVISSNLVYGYNDTEVDYPREKIKIHTPQQDTRALKQLKDDQIKLDELNRQGRLYQKKISDYLRKQDLPSQQDSSDSQAQLQELLRIKKINIFMQHSKRMALQIAFFLLAIMAMLILAYRRIFIEEKTGLERKLQEKGLLAVVNNWEFSEEDFRDYLFKLKTVAGEAFYDINTPEFKNRFLNDLVYTEICYQASFDRNIENTEFIDPKDSPLIKEAQDKDVVSQLKHYLDSISRGAPYAAYYNILFVMLFMLDKGNSFQVFEDCKKYFFIKKEMDALSGRIVVPDREARALCKESASLGAAGFEGELGRIKAELRLVRVNLALERDLLKKFRRRAKVCVRQITA